MTDMTIDNMPSILQSLQALLRREHADDLWAAAQIADYLKLSKSSVHSHILKAPAFPAPVVLPTGGKRWVAKEIRAWALKHR